MLGYENMREIAPMTLPKEQKIEEQHIESMKIAVEDVGIVALHPDRMEEFAEYLVQKVRQSEKWHKMP
jgi:hypothetical protein